MTGTSPDAGGRREPAGRGEKNAREGGAGIGLTAPPDHPVFSLFRPPGSGCSSTPLSSSSNRGISWSYSLRSSLSTCCRWNSAAPSPSSAAAPALWKTILTFGGFVGKTACFLLLYIWVRWTVPRFRYDQVMQLGWKVMLPTALTYVMIVAGTILVLDQIDASEFVFGMTLTGVSAICTVSFVFFLDRGRIIQGAAAGRRRPGSRITLDPGEKGHSR